MEYTSEKHEDLFCNQEKFRALVLRQQVTLSTQLIKPNIWLCNHSFCAALEGPFFFPALKIKRFILNISLSKQASEFLKLSIYSRIYLGNKE